MFCGFKYTVRPKTEPTGPEDWGSVGSTLVETVQIVGKKLRMWTLAIERLHCSRQPS